MGQEVLGDQPQPDYQSAATAGSDLPSPPEVANRVAGAPTMQPALTARTPHSIKQHNRGLDRLRRRDRIARAVATLALVAGAAGALVSGDALGRGHMVSLIAFLVCTVLFLICCVAFSPWGTRVGRRTRSIPPPGPATRA